MSKAKHSARPPKVKFQENEPLQDYYHDGKGGWYSVARLLDDTKDLPVFDMPLAGIDLDQVIWRDCDMLGLARHVKQCMDADLDCPILLDWMGSIADGRHRVLRAIALGKRTIKARRMTWKPDPCRQEEPRS
ncbi:hypothetical protein N5K37_29985 [Delftia tsuruhatensis]|uniref:hypothetical protein n=1 Tax=Delftia tsuruhatensis TaxID=180282 RepID=UPI00244A833A|nr:hypothetical protein [Delftia tsuruhatensis]MDH2234152.1 hypothetical protein [Delftia tsuruhatensis]